MLQVSPRTKIFVSLSPTDMRRGFNGLSAEVTQILKEDPHSGHLFLFRNRRRDRLKVLLWDNDGWVIYYNRLERGTFEFPQRKRPIIDVSPGRARTRSSASFLSYAAPTNRVRRLMGR